MSTNMQPSSLDSKVINVLITSFKGLGLPNILSIPLAASTSIDELQTQLSDRLPPLSSHLILTTTSRIELSSFLSKPISCLLSDRADEILPLRLTTQLCGGKGGFGSQLRAAGGRMSSRGIKKQGDSNSSNRNLDGRRLRTVAEAKALAEYLALKPDMEKKEKEAQRQRWEQVVELAEKKEAEARNGAARMDAKWVVEKDELREKTRDIVATMFREGRYRSSLFPNSAINSNGEDVPGSVGQKESSLQGTKDGSGRGSLNPAPRVLFGWEDEIDSSDDDDEEE